MDDFCFLGSYPFKIDPKGRINIPSKLREQLPVDGDRKLVIIKGMDTSIWIYPHLAWKAEKAELTDPRHQGDARIQRYRKILAEGAGIERPDEQGRITLPPGCRAHAGVEEGQDVLIVGNVNRIEVWAPATYAAEIQAIQEPRHEIASSYRDRVDELHARRKES